MTILDKKCSKCKNELFQNENFFRESKTLNIICGMCFEDDEKKYREICFPVTLIKNNNWEEYVISQGMKL